MKTFFVFDVESIGLHGEGYAVGYVVISQDGKTLEEGYFGCHPDDASGTRANREWVDSNIPALHASHFSPFAVREAFREVWLRWKEKGAIMAADCLWPVEANFLSTIFQAHKDREWEGPYPFIDIASVFLAKGKDPLGEYERIEGEEKKHDPLHDARQSARLLIEALAN